jgi:glycosyltransferase involved in cell wall biosynthesis|tara:strand:- start:293 stop:559 length:267 start_codon:yes stop_codon:yes gene_type:complete
MLEALSMGKPVIMTRSGCLDLDLEKEHCGVYVRSNKPTDWAQKIQSIYSDHETRKIKSQNGLRLTESIYNLKVHQTSTHLFLNQSFKT